MSGLGRGNPGCSRLITTAPATPRSIIRGYPPPILAQCGNVYFGRFHQRRTDEVTLPRGTVIRIDRVKGGAA
jgi:hypothetical protein